MADSPNEWEENRGLTRFKRRSVSLIFGHNKNQSSSSLMIQIKPIAQRDSMFTFACGRIRHRLRSCFTVFISYDCGSLELDIVGLYNFLEAHRVNHVAHLDIFCRMLVFLSFYSVRNFISLRDASITGQLLRKLTTA